MNENEINLAAAVLQLTVVGKCIKAGIPLPTLGAEDYRAMLRHATKGEMMSDNLTDVQKAHYDGYDAGYSAQEKQIQKLKEALEEIKEMSTGGGHWADFAMITDSINKIATDALTTKER